MRPQAAHYAQLWGLTPDGAGQETEHARLIPVRWRGRAAMLKIAPAAEERLGAAWLAWYGGKGAPEVFAITNEAVLMERACGDRDLSAMARSGGDDAATDILCEAVAVLHQAGPAPPWARPPEAWFGALTGSGQGGIVGRAARVAEELLSAPREVVPLHGDVHHGNVLDFGPRGWLAIDPKGLIGERGFDYANLFRNPDLADGAVPVAVRKDVFARRLEIVTRRSGVGQRRMLRWVLALCGLSVAWAGGDPVSATDLRVAELAGAMLDA